MTTAEGKRGRHAEHRRPPPRRDAASSCACRLAGGHDGRGGARAGVSRQTLYKRFGSRGELAQAYVLREAGQLVARVETAVTSNVEDPRRALSAAFDVFLSAAADNPLVRAITTDPGADELLELVTTRGGPVVAAATDRLSAVMQAGWSHLAAPTPISCPRSSCASRSAPQRYPTAASGSPARRWQRCWGRSSTTRWGESTDVNAASATLASRHGVWLDGRRSVTIATTLSWSGALGESVGAWFGVRLCGHRTGVARMATSRITALPTRSRCQRASRGPCRLPLACEGPGAPDHKGRAVRSARAGVVPASEFGVDIRVFRRILHTSTSRTPDAGGRWASSTRLPITATGPPHPAPADDQPTPAQPTPLTPLGEPRPRRHPTTV